MYETRGQDCNDGMSSSRRLPRGLRCSEPARLLAVSVTAPLGELWEVHLFVSAFSSRLQQWDRPRTLP